MTKEDAEMPRKADPYYDRPVYHVDRRNRPSQARFQCIRCGLAGPADTVAARNLAYRAGSPVSTPDVSSRQGSGTSPRALAVGS